MGGLLRLKLENDVLDIVEVKSAVLEDRRASFVRRFSAVYGPPSVCARTDLCQGLSVVRYVNDAGSEIHLSPTDLASPLPTQVKLE